MNGDELSEWRTGRRYVFWRVQDANGFGPFTFYRREYAIAYAKKVRARFPHIVVLRVPVRSRRKKVKP
jgi:hypothetical protein